MANIPNYISEIIPYSRVLKRKSGFRASIGGYIARSKFLIANEFGVDPDKVHDIFLKAWDKSEKDYPSPSIIFPQTSKEADLYNNYVLYIWKYYVEDKSKPKPPPKEPKLPNVKQPKVEEPEEEDTGEFQGYNDPEDPPMAWSEPTTKPKQPPGAIVPKMYEGVGGQDLVDEEIDERILKLLGLEDVFDIDYDTYISLLKGWAIEARMTKPSVSSEESDLVLEEYKRVRRKVGRFKINKKREQRGGVPPLQGAKNFVTGATEPPQKLLPPAGPQRPKRKATLEENVAAIRKSVESILKIMEDQFSILRRQAELDRRSREKSKRSDRENKLEGAVKKTMALAKRVLAPALSLLDRIIQFITTVLLGRALVKLMDWLADGNNQKKLQSLLRFIGDWWPTILAAWVIFATPLGKLIRTVLGGIVKMTMFMVKKGIPKLLGIIRNNPKAALATAIVGAAATGLVMQSQSKSNDPDAKEGQTQLDDTRKFGGTTGDPVGVLGEMRGGGVVPKGRLAGYSRGGKMLPSRRTQNSNGGKINGSTGRRIRGAGKDTQLVAAQPGEVVISKKAVDKFGAPFFLNLNKMGGGTNIPSYSKFSDIQFAQGGGQIGITVDDGLERLSLRELYAMLDPTEPAAKRPHVFRAAKEARERYASATREERDRQVAIATIRAKRMPEPSSSGSSTSTAGRSGASAANKIVSKPTFISNSPAQTVNKTDDTEQGGEITAKNIVSGSGSSAPFSGVLPKSPEDKSSSTSVKPAATIAKGSVKPLEAPAPPEPTMNVTTISTAAQQKALGTGAQPSGSREHDTGFDVFIQTESRMMMLAIYGITGVA